MNRSELLKMALFNCFCYILGSLWSVFFGLRGMYPIGVLGVLFLLIIQLIYTKRHSLALYIEDIIIMPIVIFFGTLLEMTFIRLKIVHYADALSHFPPIWMIAIYALFSLLLNHSLMQVSKKQLPTFLSGFFGVPISYMIGHFFTDLSFPHGKIIAWLVLGSFWGLFLCFLRAITNRIEAASKKTFQEMNQKRPLKLFYDGGCPICSKEMKQLNKRNADETLKFIDISSKRDFERERKTLSYEQAMSQMHALDANGNLLFGLDAFAAAYAHCNRPFISTLLNISFLRPLLNPLYRLFAKHRMYGR